MSGGLMVCVVIVSIMIAILLFLNARGPARYHIGYPTLVRASAGIYGSLVFIFIRGVSFPLSRLLIDNTKILRSSQSYT